MLGFRKIIKPRKLPSGMVKQLTRQSWEPKCLQTQKSQKQLIKQTRSWLTRFQRLQVSKMLITGIQNAFSWLPPLWPTQWASQGLGLTRKQHKQVCMTNSPRNGDGTHNQREIHGNLRFSWTQSIGPALVFSLASRSSIAWVIPTFPLCTENSR